jgi:DNA-binding protein HU-beta
MSTAKSFQQRLGTALPDIAQRRTNQIVKTFATTMVAEIKACGAVVLPGIGKFQLQRVPERPGRNPLTGEKLTVPAHNKLKFVAAKDLKENL